MFKLFVLLLVSLVLVSLLAWLFLIKRPPEKKSDAALRTPRFALNTKTWKQGEIPGLSFRYPPFLTQVGESNLLAPRQYYLLRDEQDSQRQIFFRLTYFTADLCPDGALPDCAREQARPVGVEIFFQKLMEVMQQNPGPFVPQPVDITIGKSDPSAVLGKKFTKVVSDKTDAGSVKVFFYFPQGVYAVEDMRETGNDDELFQLFLGTLDYKFIRI